MCAARLVEWCRIPTSGARAVEPFDIGGTAMLAVPQLAYDVPGEPANLNGGDSDTSLLLLRRTPNGYERFQELPVPGGEDAEVFRIGDQAFLATASIRTGHGPYEFATDSVLFEWTGSDFAPYQRFPTFAAKQWRHFAIGDQHFLALAQGVALPSTAHHNQPSRIFRWDGSEFVPFQDIPTRWAYNWHAFTVDGQHFLASADHAAPSRLYRWDGETFAAHQDLAPKHGRAFATFRADDADYLLVGCITGDSRLLRWNGAEFADHDVLDGTGAREFAVHRSGNELYVLRVNFIQGAPSAPTTALSSQLYQWQQGKLVVVDEFATFGATDVAVTRDEHGPLVAVSNGLSASVRFATETVVYRFVDQPGSRG